MVNQIQKNAQDIEQRLVMIEKTDLFKRCPLNKLGQLPSCKVRWDHVSFLCQTMTFRLSYLQNVYIFVCLSISVYVCVYVCLYVCMSVRMYVCMYDIVCMYVCLFVCMYVSLYVCQFVCMYVCMLFCMYVCMFVCDTDLFQIFTYQYLSKTVY